MNPARRRLPWPQAGSACSGQRLRPGISRLKPPGYPRLTARELCSWPRGIPTGFMRIGTSLRQSNANTARWPWAGISSCAFTNAPFQDRQPLKSISIPIPGIGPSLCRARKPSMSPNSAAPCPAACGKALPLPKSWPLRQIPCRKTRQSSLPRLSRWPRRLQRGPRPVPGRSTRLPRLSRWPQHLLPPPPTLQDRPRRHSHPASRKRRYRRHPRNASFTRPAASHPASRKRRCRRCSIWPLLKGLCRPHA